MPHGERAAKRGLIHQRSWQEPHDPRYRVRTVVVTVEPASEPKPEPYPFQRTGLLFWRV